MDPGWGGAEFPTGGGWTPLTPPLAPALPYTETQFSDQLTLRLLYNDISFFPNILFTDLRAVANSVSL